jgi:predicted RNase H-like HicB family nuclease
MAQKDYFIMGYKPPKIYDISRPAIFDEPADPTFHIMKRLLKESKMISVDSYSLIVFLGDDDGNHVPNGDVWWAWSKELDTMGDGETPEKAIHNCQEGMRLKISCIMDKGLPVPSRNVITMG